MVGILPRRLVIATMVYFTSFRGEQAMNFGIFKAAAMELKTDQSGTNELSADDLVPLAPQISAVSDSIGPMLSIASPAFRKPRTIDWLPRREVTAGLSDGWAIARRDMVIGQYLIDATIRPILLARVVFRNATRARRNLRVKK